MWRKATSQQFLGQLFFRLFYRYHVVPSWSYLVLPVSSPFKKWYVDCLCIFQLLDPFGSFSNVLLWNFRFAHFPHFPLCIQQVAPSEKLCCRRRPVPSFLWSAANSWIRGSRMQAFAQTGNVSDQRTNQNFVLKKSSAFDDDMIPCQKALVFGLGQVRPGICCN